MSSSVSSSARRLAWTLRVPQKSETAFRSGLAVHPLGPQPAVRLEQAPADIPDGRQSSLQQFVVDDEGASLLHDLLKSGMVEPDGKARRDQVEGPTSERLDKAAPIGPDAVEDAVLDVELKGQLGGRGKPIDVAQGPPVFRSQALTGDAEDASGVERDPGHVDGIGIRLNENGDVEGKGREWRVTNRAWPAEIEAAQMSSDRTAEVHTI